MTASSDIAVLQREAESELRFELARFVVPGFALLGALLILVKEAYGGPRSVQVLGLILLLFPIPVWLLLSRAYAAAASLLVLGAIAIDLWALANLSSGAILCLLALPVVLGFALLGRAAGLFSALLASVAIWQVTHWPAVTGAAMGAALIAIWGAAGLSIVLGHLAGQTSLALWSNYVRMQVLLDEARDQRLELKQTQVDLAQANAELARLSDRLAHMARLAEEARRAKEEFVASVSHELRTPLNMIIGFTEMISEMPQAYGGVPPALLADVQVILRNSRHLASLVDDVLDLSQVEAGQMTLNREWVDLSDLVAEAAVAVRPLYEAKALCLDFDLPASLPPLFCDRTRIRQVMLNLLSNAGRFTERGGVTIQARVDAGQVMVSVRDTGPGIAPEHRERIFAPFQQADGSIRRRFGGTGLGLNISKRFVEMHGGRMWLESEVGVGSTFHFCLPLPDAAPHATPSSLRWLSPDFEYRQRMRPSRASVPDLPPRIAVCERGSALQRLLARYMDGVQVVVTRSVPEAVAELRRSQLQALVINEPFHEQGQADMLCGIKDLPYNIPVLRCWVPGEEDAAEQLGVVRYLVKPVSREALLATVASLGEGVRRLLLVDDEPEVLRLFSRMLASDAAGYRVLRAPNGHLALKLMRERLPDAVLLDVMMPGVDGLSVLYEKARDPAIRDIPVIAISASDPRRGPLLGNMLTLVRGGGLALRDLLTALQVWGEVDPLSKAASDPVSPPTHGGSVAFAETH